PVACGSSSVLEDSTVCRYFPCNIFSHTCCTWFLSAPEVFNRLKEINAQKYLDNYSMQKTLVQDQCESYRYLQSYTSVSGVPQDVVIRLKQTYAGKYPYNFSMQKTLIQDQVKSYLELHK
ncbi:MAG: hypothetical protein ABIS18_05415, partial [Actinomycetota bacterium]